MAKMFDKVSQSFLDAIKGVVESTAEYEKSMDAEKKKNISSSDKKKLSKLAALMKAEKKPVSEAKKCKECDCEKCKCEKEDDEKGEMKEANLTGLPKSTAEKNKQYIEITHLLGHKRRVPVHPTNAYKALNRYRNDPSTKSARIVSEDAEQIDEISTKLAIDYTGKAADARGHKKLSTAKLDKRYKSMALAHEKIRGRHAKVPTTEEVELEEAMSSYDRYTSTHADATKLLKSIGDHLATHKKDAISHTSSFDPKKKGPHWGHVGDIDHVHRQLKDIHDQLAQRGEYAKMHEETEDLYELSKGTLGRYIYKAANQVGEKGITAGLKIGDSEDSKKEFKTMGKRQKGIAKAVSKLTKEDQEFIDSINAEMFEEIELEESTAKVADHLIKRYGENVRKSHVRSAANDFGVGFVALSHHVRKKLGVNRLQEEQIDEARGRPKKAAAKDFTVHPRTGEKLMHNNPEHMARIEKLQKHGVLDKPKTEAGQHIINQLRKASTSMQGGATVHFTHGESKHVSAAHAGKALDKYASMKPNEKEDFQKKISHSHEQMMKHI